jgi:hypothetical protein
VALQEFDPNEALEKIRKGGKELQGLIDQGHVFGATWRSMVAESAELDEWLSKGGYPPAAWDPFSKSPVPTVTGRTTIRPPATPEQHARGKD